MDASVLLTPPSIQIAVFTDFFIFFSYAIIAAFLVYIGKSINYKGKVTLPWLILSAGLLFSSLNIMLEAVGETPGIIMSTKPVLWYLFSLIGGVCLLTGLAMTLLERILNINVLRARESEILDVMEYLKGRYYKKELSEEDLRKLHAKLLEELAEIEVKLKKSKKK